MTPNTARGESWLPLLQWDPQRAAKLPDIVERIQPEPHPVSGELELDEVRPAKYRRLDEETLQSRLEVVQYEILPIYVWCENDEHGQTGPGWKLAELRSLEDTEDGTVWFASISEANDAAEEAANTHSIAVPQSNGNGNGNSHAPIPTSAEEEEDDGSYWAAYDTQPSETPAKGPSPAPPRAQQPQAQTTRERSQSELDYFDSYANVQPAMDGHDPDEEYPELSETSLRGNTLNVERQPPPRIQTISVPQQRSLYPADKPHDSALQSATALSQPEDISMPRAISPTTSHSSVEKLEEAAAALNSSSRDSERARLAIQHHISTDIKSLFRLARSAGMERKEFSEFVERELSVLAMLEADD